MNRRLVMRESSGSAGAKLPFRCETRWVVIQERLRLRRLSDLGCFDTAKAAGIDLDVGAGNRLIKQDFYMRQLDLFVPTRQALMQAV